MLTEAIEEGSRARGRDDVVEMPWPEPRARRPGFPVVGCLGRIVGLVFLLIVMVVIFLLVLFGGFFIG
jgi:hypothetical protein